MNFRPRAFAEGDPGYHNGTLGTTGVAIPFPTGSSGCIVSVSAGCFVGIRGSDTLDTFDDDHYGSILNGHPYTFTRQFGGDEDYLHIAPWSSTAAIAVVFV